MGITRNMCGVRKQRLMQGGSGVGWEFGFCQIVASATQGFYPPGFCPEVLSRSELLLVEPDQERSACMHDGPPETQPRQKQPCLGNGRMCWHMRPPVPPVWLPRNACVDGFCSGKKPSFGSIFLETVMCGLRGEHVWVQETMHVARRLRCWLGNWLLPSSGFCHTGFLPMGFLPRGLEPIIASARRARPGEVRMHA